MPKTKKKKKEVERESLEFYWNLHYPVTLYPDSEGGYVGEIKDLPGCLTQGETADETVSNMEEARRLWIASAYEDGDEIPLPSTETRYSGKVLLRMPCSLHKQLVENAEREGVSLNQYVLALLSQKDATKTIGDLSDKLDKLSASLSQVREIEISAKNIVLKTILREIFQNEPSTDKKSIDERQIIEAFFSQEARS